MTPYRQVCWLATVGALFIAALASPIVAQSLEERLDEDAFLRGLVDLDLPDLLEHYIRTHAGDDPVREARFRIAAERMRMREAGASSNERLAALERILAIRSDLIESHRGDRRRGEWLADQCADLLFELLPVDASGLTTLFGLPSEEQAERAQRVARELNERSALAEIEIDRAIFDLESRSDYRDDEALQAQRRHLVRDQRDRRIPFFRGIGAFLHAELNLQRVTEREDLYETAARSLEPLADRLDGPLVARARVYHGLALARLRRFDDAEAQFRAAATSEDALPADVFSARMGGVLNREIDRGPEAALRALDSIESRYAQGDALLYRVLIADRRFLLRRRMAEGLDEARRRDALASAFDAYLDLLDRESSLPRRTVRAVVFDRLVRAAAGELPLDQLPPIVTVARADRLARDPERRDEAITLLRSVRARPDADATERAAALFTLGRTFYASERPIDAAEAFHELAESYPRDVEAERAIELAASLSTRAANSAPNDPAAATLQRRVLDLLLERYPSLPTITRWRYEAGRAAMRAGEFARSIELFGRIPSSSSYYIDTQFMRLGALRAAIEPIDAAADRATRARDLLDEIGRVERLIEEELRSAETDRREDLRYYLAYLKVHRAFAQLRLDEPQRALAAIEGLVDEAGVDAGLRAEALRFRIEANRALGNADEARSAVDRLFETDAREAERIVASLLGDIQQRVDTLLDQGRGDEARNVAASEMLPLIERLEPRLESLPVDESTNLALLRLIADGYRYAERYDDGLRAYRRLERRAPETIEVLFGRAECLFGLEDGDLAQAMKLYRRIAAAGMNGARSHYFWQSQVRMLQILDRVEKNTDQIVPRIRRLRLQDPKLGGPRYRRQFERLELKHGTGVG